MSKVIHYRHVTDTLKLLAVTLQAKNLADVMTPLDLTSATGTPISFKMINAATGATTIALTTTGVTYTASSAGYAYYDFSAAGVLAAGIYHGFFVYTDTAETDHYPFAPGDLVIEIHSDTQTAAEAYRAAVESV